MTTGIIGMKLQDVAKLAGVSYLISLGHKNIALISDTSKALVTPRMIKGYKKALQEKKSKLTQI